MSTVTHFVLTADRRVERVRVDSGVLEALCFVQIHHTPDWSVRLWVPLADKGQWLGWGRNRRLTRDSKLTASEVWSELVKDGQLRFPDEDDLGVALDWLNSRPDLLAPCDA